jgi:hypothetical protein
MVSQVDPWAQVYQEMQEEQVQDQQPEVQVRQAQESDPWARESKMMKEEEEESSLDYLYRQIKRTKTRAVEAGLGFPGNTVKAVKWLADMLPKSPESLQRKPNIVQKFGKKLLESLPTSHELKQVSQELYGDEVEPRNELEKHADETAETFVSMFMPGTRGIPVLAKTVGPVAAQAAKWGAEKIGLEPMGQEIAKNAVLLGLSVASQQGSRQMAHNAMTASEQLAPQGASFPTQQLENALTNIEQTPWMRTALRSPNPSPSARPAIRAIQNIRALFRNGRMDVQDTIQARKDLNEIARNLGAFEIEHGGDQAAAIARLGQVRDALVNDGLAIYGRQNPAFWAANQAANQAFAVSQRGGAIAEFIIKNYHKPFMSDAMKILFGNIAGGGMGAIGKTAAIGSSMVGLNLAARSLYRIAQSPMIARHYGAVLRNAASGNVAEMNKHLAKLDKELRKEEIIDQVRKP